jgi:hypothetical protein
MAFVGKSPLTPGWQNGIKDIDNAIAKLTLFKARLEDPIPAMMDILAEFALMEGQRFVSGGSAPEFGINEKWLPITEKTIKARTAKGGNPGPAKAATSGDHTPFGKKSMAIIIDPRNHGAREFKGYLDKDGENYGTFHQQGTRGRERREFVTITPTFTHIAKLILESYLTQGIVEQKTARADHRIPSNNPIKADVRKASKRIDAKIKTSAKTMEEKRLKAKVNKTVRQPVGDITRKYKGFGEHAHTINPNLTPAQHEENLTKALKQTSSVRPTDQAGMLAYKQAQVYTRIYKAFLAGDSHLRTK